MYDWFSDTRSRNLPSIVQAQAKVMAKRLNKEDFKELKVRLQSFHLGYKITFGQIIEENLGSKTKKLF